jgi:CheY-like chemotaxis protein
VDVQKVLMVDDEDAIRRLGELSLAKIGRWTALVARSGAEGFALARSERPDVILLDVMMPEADGLATFERLRREPGTSSIPVIFMTAAVERGEVGQYLSMGAAGVIPKPFSPMALPAQIRRILEVRP